MGVFRFRRSIRLGPGLRLNLGKRGASVSLGVRGAHVTLGNTGVRTTVGLPGTGLSYTEQTPSASAAPAATDPSTVGGSPGRARSRWLVIALLTGMVALLVVFFMP